MLLTSLPLVLLFSQAALPNAYASQQPSQSSLHQQLSSHRQNTQSSKLTQVSEGLFVNAGSQQGQQQQQLGSPRLPTTPLLSIHQGPGVDLVAFNKRRFELGHNHQSADDGEGDLKQAQLFEANLNALPDKLLANLPTGVNRQVLESMATDPTLNLPSFVVDTLNSNQQQQRQKLQQPDDEQHGGGGNSDDLDGASVERLTKSCLTVHASSARPEQLNVTFHLYTKKNPHRPYLFHPNITRLELIKGSPFALGKPIKWITHGFHTNVDKSEWMLEAKDKILTFEDANVFLTDWRRGASPAMAFYPKAAANAHVVAKMIVRILRRLRNDIEFNRVHLIGHSLGAHVMGFVGSAFTEEHLLQQQKLLMLRPGATDGEAFWREPAASADSQLIGRITACDPALPCFGPTSSAASSPLPVAPLQSQLAETSQPSPILPAVAPASASANIGDGNGDGSSLTNQPTEGQTAAAVREDGLGGAGANNFADWTPSMWTHLRPDSAVVVEVMHSNPGVMGYAEPLGDYDFYPNGFERQPGCGVNQADGSFAATLNERIAATTTAIRNIDKRQLMSSIVGSVVSLGQQRLRAAASAPPGERSRLSQTLDRFIRPIKDFLHGYTCSHHRAVDYMVESMYYGHIPYHRKLDESFVCQMVGYRCSDYTSFKRGFCFKCFSELDCRAFTMLGNSIPTDSLNAADVLKSPPPPPPPPSPLPPRAETGHLTQSNPVIRQQPSAGRIKRSNAGLYHFHGEHTKSFRFMLNQTSLPSSPREIDRHLRSHDESRPKIFKRVLPTLNYYDQSYRRSKGNQYFFDTRHTKEFCLHHYHLFVKYRWFRVRDAVVIDGFKLAGSLANITQQTQVIFHRFTYQSYTMLLTDRSYLGKIDSLTVFGERIKPALIEYIEVSYMSNLDQEIRALSSARLCRAQSNEKGLSNTENFVTEDLPASSLSPNKLTQPSSATLFIMCSGNMV